MWRVNLVIAVVILAVISPKNCLEFEEEFDKGEDGGSSREAPFLAGLPDIWRGGFFRDDGDDFLFRSRPKADGGDHKETSTNEGDGQPFDVDFVSQPVGGGGGGAGFYGDLNPFFGGSFPFGGGLFPFNFGGGGGAGYKPWWKGDNVCVEREEDIVDWAESEAGLSGAFSLNFETCEDKPNKHICTSVTNVQGKKRTVTVSRKCCHGYAPSRAANGHCVKFELQSVIEVAEKLGAKEFIRSAKNNGLEEKLAENVTLFAPLDEAFTDFAEQMFETNLVVLPLARNHRAAPKDVSGITTKDLALAHIVKGFNSIEEIENEQLLTTEFENATIRMNVFPKSHGSLFTYTANCVPLTSYDKLAANGLVHGVESVLVPATQTLLEIVEKRSDLAVFRTLLEKTDLAEQLNNQDKTFTLFAPNDEAFSKLEPNIRRIVKDGNGCALNILKNHVLDLTFCGAAVIPKAKTSTFNLLGEKLIFEFSAVDDDKNSTDNETEDLKGDEKILINKQATITESDLMASNGVLHIIDTVLETNSASPVTSVMEKQNLTIFKRLIEAAGLDETFDTMSNASFFIPTDKAFEETEWKKKLDEEPESLKDNEDLKQFLDYHIAQSSIKTCNLSEESIETRSEGKLRVNLYSTHPIFSNVMNRATVNCARLTKFDVDTCGSVLHQVDRVLTPPQKSLLELLEETGKYSKFLKLVQAANLTGLFETSEKEYTLLVPNDEVFAEQDEWYQRLLNDNEKLENIVKSHILPDVLCCTGIVASDWPFVRTIKTINEKSLRIDRKRRPEIGNAGITKCDVLATNGIVHEVNDVIIIKESARRPPLFF